MLCVIAIFNEYHDVRERGINIFRFILPMKLSQNGYFWLISFPGHVGRLLKNASKQLVCQIHYKKAIAIVFLYYVNNSPTQSGI